MTYQLIQASAHDTGLPDKSVHCVITSPPYFSLRRYQGEQSIVWREMQYAPMPGLAPITIPSMTCGLGEEETPEAFIGHLILVMREMWRILRDDGVMWCNLGDSYNGSGGAGGDYGAGGIREGQPKFPGRKIGTLKPKDLMGIPWRFAFAAQADGWYLRSDVIWAKRNPMPESVTDRPTKAHEYIYLLTKNEKYYYDAGAIKEENAGKLPYGDKREFKMNDDCAQGKHGKSSMFSGGSKQEYIDKYYTNGRNKRTVWSIASQPYAGAHFATFPIEIPLTCIKASCPPDGVVCDPFSGSGTTGRAALQLNRSYIGIDVSQEYLEDLAPERLSNVQIELAFA